MIMRDGGGNWIEYAEKDTSFIAHSRDIQGELT
jgi:hypothetical protein